MQGSQEPGGVRVPRKLDAARLGPPSAEPGGADQGASGAAAAAGQPRMAAAEEGRRAAARRGERAPRRAGRSAGRRSEPRAGAACSPWGADPPGAPERPTAGGFLDGPRCRALCTARACCHLVQALLCILSIVCSSVSYNSVGGYTGLFSLGSAYYYPYGGAYSGFAGADGEKAQHLDAQFQQLKLPPARAAMAVGGALLAVVCLQIVAGLLQVPSRCPTWLLAEALVEVAVAVGLFLALYFYYSHLHTAYASFLCKERESLYHSKGYSGFGCSLHGAEVAVGFFAGVAIVAFFLSAFLAVRDFWTTHNRQAKPTAACEI